VLQTAVLQTAVLQTAVSQTAVRLVLRCAADRVQQPGKLRAQRPRPSHGS
jgi:hypothetical protein